MKILKIALAVLSVLVFSGCGEDKVENKTNVYTPDGKVVKITLNNELEISHKTLNSTPNLNKLVTEKFTNKDVSQVVFIKNIAQHKSVNIITGGEIITPLILVVVFLNDGFERRFYIEETDSTIKKLLEESNYKVTVKGDL